MIPTRDKNRPFPSYFEPHYESEAKCKVFVMKISFHSYANKPNFHMKSSALSLAFIVRFTAIRKWFVAFAKILLQERTTGNCSEKIDRKGKPIRLIKS